MAGEPHRVDIAPRTQRLCGVLRGLTRLRARSRLARAARLLERGEPCSDGRGAREKLAVQQPGRLGLDAACPISTG